MQLLFLFYLSQMLCSTLGRDLDKNKTILSMGGDPMAVGSIMFIILNQAVGRSKFDHGPDLAHGPDFGHACSNTL